MADTLFIYLFIFYAFFKDDPGANVLHINLDSSFGFFIAFFYARNP